MSDPTRVYTWNVNGIRACARKGFLEWLVEERPDVVCLQETKAHAEQLPEELADPDGYEAHWFPAKKRGYSGTALLTRVSPLEVKRGLGIEEYDDEGRTLIAEFDRFVLVNCYFPNSQREHARLPYKLGFDAAIKEYCDREREAGRPVILTGDFNAAHTEIDLANPKQNEKNAGFLPEERAWVTEMLEAGYVDVFRELHPEEEGHYTWWSYRSNARARNIGWRLDYFLVSPELAQEVKDVTILSDVMGSDHCPVRLELEGRGKGA